MKITASFSLSISDEDLAALCREGNTTFDPRVSADLFREDLEETLPAKDYEPFVRSAFEITVEP